MIISISSKVFKPNILARLWILFDLFLYLTFHIFLTLSNCSIFRMNPLEIKGKYLHCDLNVPYHGESKLADRLKMIKRMDWDAVCINTLVKSGQDIPPPPTVKEDFGLRIFNRVTVSYK